MINVITIILVTIKKLYDIVIMLIWNKMMYIFMTIAMSKIRALHLIKINLEPNYANLVIKSNKIIYK